MDSVSQYWNSVIIQYHVLLGWHVIRVQSLFRFKLRDSIIVSLDSINDRDDLWNI